MGLYGSNPLGPGGQSSIILWYVDPNGRDQSSAQAYAINVAVPAPGAVGLMGIAGVLAARRRRR